VTRQSQHNPTYGGKEFVFGVDPEVADVVNLNFKLFNWNHGKNDDLLVGSFIIKLIDLTLDPIEQQTYNFFEGRSSERRVMGANAPTNAVVSVRWVSASGVVAGGGDAGKGTEKETNRKTIGDEHLFNDTITAKPSQWAEVERAARRAARDADAAKELEVLDTDTKHTHTHTHTRRVGGSSRTDALISEIADSERDGGCAIEGKSPSARLPSAAETNVSGYAAEASTCQQPTTAGGYYSPRESLLPEKVYQPVEISPRGAGSGLSSMSNVAKSLPSPPVAAGRKYGGGDQCPRCFKTVYVAEAKEGPNLRKYHK